MSTPAGSAILRRMQFGVPGKMSLLPTPPMATSTAPVTDPSVKAGVADPTVASKISPTPAIDVNGYMSKLAPSGADEHPVAAAIARALSGFGQGAAATPESAKYSPGAAGVIGGLAGTGNQMMNERKMNWEMDQPRRELTLEALKESIKHQVADPYKQADIERNKASQMSILDERYDRAGKLFKQQAASRAAESGVSAADYEKLQKEANQNAMMQGVLPGDPGYEALIDSHINGTLQRMKAAGVKGTGKVPAAAPVPKTPIKTAQDYLSR